MNDYSELVIQLHNIAREIEKIFVIALIDYTN